MQRMQRAILSNSMHVPIFASEFYGAEQHAKAGDKLAMRPAQEMLSLRASMNA